LLDCAEVLSLFYLHDSGAHFPDLFRKPFLQALPWQNGLVLRFIRDIPTVIERSKVC
jgi:hypothetical protein